MSVSCLSCFTLLSVHVLYCALWSLVRHVVHNFFIIVIIIIVHFDCSVVNIDNTLRVLKLGSLDLAAMTLLRVYYCCIYPVSKTLIHGNSWTQSPSDKVKECHADLSKTVGFIHHPFTDFNLYLAVH